MHLIFPQKKNDVVYGYKVHTSISDKTVYKNFSDLDAAKMYRDEIVVPIFKKRIADMEKRVRDIEFQRGLRDKINNGENDEVMEILTQYDLKPEG